MLSLFEKLFVPVTNAPEAATLLAGILKVKIAQTTLTKEIESHPDYPSLLSISDALTHYGIENVAIKLDPLKLGDAPTPFITQIKSDKSPGEMFSVVKEITTHNISFFDPIQHIWTTTSREFFLKKFSGTILLAEAGEHAGEKEYEMIVAQEKKKRLMLLLSIYCLPVIAICSGILAIIQKGAASVLPFAFLMLALFGSILGAVLIWYELDQYNPILSQICNAGKKINCGAILQSKASKIAGIGWSTIGFGYFTGQLLLLLFTGINNQNTLFAAGCISIAALPYTFYSLYYQYRVAKQWCVLCLCVQATLVLQFTTAIAGNWVTFTPARSFDFSSILTIASAFVIPFISATWLIPLLEKAKESRQSQRKLLQLKHNPQIFDSLLATQRAVTESAEGLGILLGNPAARHKLIKVCNPYCGPCAKAHMPIEELLANNPDVQVQIIFTSTNKEGDYRMPPVKHLLAIAEKNDMALTKKALDDWYLAEKNDYSVFASKYPMNGELKKQDGKIEAMSNWCDKTGINFTPTFFISRQMYSNGEAQLTTTMMHQLPEIYSVSDLKFFLSC